MSNVSLLVCPDRTVAAVSIDRRFFMPVSQFKFWCGKLNLPVPDFDLLECFQCGCCEWETPTSEDADGG